MKVFREVRHGPRTKWLDFGGDADHVPDPVPDHDSNPDHPGRDRNPENRSPSSFLVIFC